VFSVPAEFTSNQPSSTLPSRFGIIDFGFTGYPARQTAGDLPATLTAVDNCNGLISASGMEHGTVVAEVVYKMAPNAQIYLLCVDTEV
jgi:hypothetical protein